MLPNLSVSNFDPTRSHREDESVSTLSWDLGHASSIHRSFVNARGVSGRYNDDIDESALSKHRTVHYEFCFERTSVPARSATLYFDTTLFSSDLQLDIGRLFHGVSTTFLLTRPLCSRVRKYDTWTSDISPSGILVDTAVYVVQFRP